MTTTISRMFAFDAASRFTATRLALFGPLGLGLRKRTGHNHTVFTTADGQQAMVDVDPNHTITEGARRFVVEFNNLALQLVQEHWARGRQRSRACPYRVTCHTAWSQVSRAGAVLTTVEM